MSAVSEVREKATLNKQLEEILIELDYIYIRKICHQ